MTDRAQFEAMLEALINEDQEAAKEIFHNIVVAKSREIYEELLAEDFGQEEEEEEVDGDESDDFIDDAEDDTEEDDTEEDDTEEDDTEEDDTEEDEGDLQDQIYDIKTALSELEAEFEQLMAGEKAEPEHSGMFGDEDEFGGEEDEFGGEEDEFGSDEFGGEEDEMDEAPKTIKHIHYNGGDEPMSEKDDYEAFMEYVNKVALPKHGDNGANTRSIVASKNSMGGTSANIVKGGTSETGGTQGGLLKPSTTRQDAGNVNVPGSTRANKLSSVSGGHGAEKKGAGENASNKTSIIGKKVR